MVTVFGDATTAPCSFDVDVSCCTDWDTFNQELQTNAMEYGAYVMWAATGRQFGLCTRTVRPCGRFCGTNPYGGYFWSEGTWQPYIFGGEWFNCACGNTGCGTCAPNCQVWLPGPVASVSPTGVSLSDEIIPVDSWRVDNGQWLVRTDGECWPECQDFNVDSGDNTFFVTYQRGLPVPSVVARAAGELACEWAKSCMGQPCRLPQRVQSVTRQGVSISMVPIEDLLRFGLTGLETVDQVIRSINPSGLTSRMRMASPDLPVTRIVTG
jgi:hypothetical protein